MNACRACVTGWDQGLLNMCVGEKRKLQIPPHLGYGETGAAPSIPGGATLIFDVEVRGQGGGVWVGVGGRRRRGGGGAAQGTCVHMRALASVAAPAPSCATPDTRTSACPARLAPRPAAGQD
jgi:hypothetical protein